MSQKSLVSPVLVRNEAGATLDRPKFKAFGAPIQIAANTGNQEKWGLGGERLDTVTGLYTLGARHYAPTSGLFTSADPLALKGDSELFDDPQQLNAFQYAKNQPLTYVDPSGNSPLLIPAAAAFVVGGATTLVYDRVFLNKPWKEILINAAITGTAAGSSVLLTPWMTPNAAPMILGRLGTIGASQLATTLTGRVLSSAALTPINAGAQWMALGKVDFVKAGLSSIGYTPTAMGVMTKFGVGSGARAMSEVGEAAASAAVKSFLSSTNSFAYSTIKNTIQFGQATGSRSQTSTQAAH